MPDPLSTTLGIWLGYATVQAYARESSAVSSEARVLREAVNSVVGLTERSQALFGSKSVAISQLRTIANECTEAGWDGYKASPIEWTSVRLAEEFIRAMPYDLPLPEFAPEPDGSISLDWIQSRNRLFSLSVGMTNRLAYAWLDGSDKGYGVARFDGERIPPRVIEGITGVMNHGTAPFGAR
jgi:hypothetical protein